MENENGEKQWVPAIDSDDLTTNTNSDDDVGVSLNVSFPDPFVSLFDELRHHSALMADAFKDTFWTAPAPNVSRERIIQRQTPTIESSSTDKGDRSPPSTPTTGHRTPPRQPNPSSYIPPDSSSSIQYSPKDLLMDSLHRFSTKMVDSFFARHHRPRSDDQEQQQPAEAQDVTPRRE